jgi:serine/threonine protein kinase
MSRTQTTLIDMNLGALLKQLREGGRDVHDVAAQLASWGRQHHAGTEHVKVLLQAAVARRELSQAHHGALLSAIPMGDSFDQTMQRNAAGASHANETLARNVATPVSQAPPNRTLLEPGVVIRGRYVLNRLLGIGGMGQVWKAKDLVSERARDPNPFVAIKLLSSNFEADPDGFVALQRETKKAQELAHPNVSTVYGFDIDDGGSGRAFMSMELLEGETLDAVIRNHPAGLTRTNALPLIIGMAKGLEYAHKKGLVHSDFKPGNVFVAQSGVPKVLDFGIARAAKIAGVERLEDSFDAGSLGGMTLPYASPEMIEQQAPHPADDVYALGLVVYELLSGHHPFERRMAVEARDRQLHPARLRSVRRHEWQAIARALAFDRLQRWQNAGEFLRAYEGKSVAVKALGALALGLAVATGIFWYQAYTESRPSVPFESLPADVQADFRTHMANADGEWRLVQEGNGDESLNAASEYGKAYALHPRNPEATAGLKKSADYIVDRLNRVADRAQRLQQLKSVQDLSDFYANYKPLVAAIEEAGGG